MKAHGVFPGDDDTGLWTSTPFPSGNVSPERFDVEPAPAPIRTPIRFEQQSRTADSNQAVLEISAWALTNDGRRKIRNAIDFQVHFLVGAASD